WSSLPLKRAFLWILSSEPDQWPSVLSWTGPKAREDPLFEVHLYPPCLPTLRAPAQYCVRSLYGLKPSRYRPARVAGRPVRLIGAHVVWSNALSVIEVVGRRVTGIGHTEQWGICIWPELRIHRIDKCIGGSSAVDERRAIERAIRCSLDIISYKG